jgi:hypothetical protein
VLLLAASAAARDAAAQALFTGEIGGKGTRSLVLTANAIRPRDFTTFGNFWAAYAVGVHRRMDAFILYGNTTGYGRTQHYVGAGSNIGILRRDRQAIDASFLNIFTVPLSRRSDSSTALALLAPIASRPVHLGSYSVTLYGGYLLTAPIGQRAGKFFTPPGPVHNGIIGAVLPVSKTLSLIAEYNPGRAQRCRGVAVLYVFPRD